MFDLPASGHSVSMLRIPWVITDTVPEGPLTRDARTINQLLTDPKRTMALIVTLAEEMPFNEAIELEQKLTALGIVPQHVICNGSNRSTSRRAGRSQGARRPRRGPHAGVAARGGHRPLVAVARPPRAQRPLPRRASRAREGAGDRATDHLHAAALARAGPRARREDRASRPRSASGTAARRGSRAGRRCSRSRRRSSCRRARRARA